MDWECCVIGYMVTLFLYFCFCMKDVLLYRESLVL